MWTGDQKQNKNKISWPTTDPSTMHKIVPKIDQQQWTNRLKCHIEQQNGERTKAKKKTRAKVDAETKTSWNPICGTALQKFDMTKPIFEQKLKTKYGRWQQHRLSLVPKMKTWPAPPPYHHHHHHHRVNASQYIKWNFLQFCVGSFICALIHAVHIHVLWGVLTLFQQQVTSECVYWTLATDFMSLEINNIRQWQSEYSWPYVLYVEQCLFFFYFVFFFNFCCCHYSALHVVTTEIFWFDI